MEISSRTIISWFFHLHGSVRARASKISCASSVTFSPMLSVDFVFIVVDIVVKERERERERESCQWRKKDPREWYITERLDFPNTRRNNASNDAFHSETIKDVQLSKITRRRTNEHARR